MQIPPFGSPPATDKNIRTSDVTNNNVSTTKHGFAPKITDETKFLKGDGTWSNPIPTGQLFLSAAGMWPSTTSGCATNAKSELATNKINVYTLDFDTTTQEFAEVTVAMPSDWNAGTITFAPYWTHPATDTNFGVVWQLQGRSYANDDALDQAFGTEQTSTDTGGTTNDLYIGPTSSAITLAGSPAAGQLVQFRVARVPGNGSDTLAVDAKLIGIMVNYTRS